MTLRASPLSMKKRQQKAGLVAHQRVIKKMKRAEQKFKVLAHYKVTAI